MMVVLFQLHVIILIDAVRLLCGLLWLYFVNVIVEPCSEIVYYKYLEMFNWFSCMYTFYFYHLPCLMKLL